jgi:hypothetical protein
MMKTRCALGLSLAVGLSLAGCGDSAMGPAAEALDLATSAADLGACTCPGQGLGNAEVTCGNDLGLTCQLTCRGENYDVDGNPQNGCEILHSVPPGHNQASAGDRGSLSCTDTSTDTILGFLLSDSRAHTNPTVGSFSAQVGSAPDYYRVAANGGLLCVNDYAVSFGTSGGNSLTQCYQCTIITDKKTQSVTATGNDLVQMTSGSSSYSGGTDIYFKIEKICSLPRQEAIRYQVMYHL